MERLTTFVDGNWVLSRKKICEGYDKYSVVSRLAAYEDSGLMPKEVAELQAKMERLRLELLKSQTENERLKRVEESAKKLLDSCLEGESENGDEIDYIEQLRAENKKLKQDIRQCYFDHGVLLKENERLKAVAEAALGIIEADRCLCQDTTVKNARLMRESLTILKQALAEYNGTNIIAGGE